MSDYSGILQNQAGQKQNWERAIKKIVIARELEKG